jgi:acyl-CoA synthetase (AMP-forming)/AMP-acid ligase II/acetyltransferase-like isoleucine patch superfamily enzyme
MDAIVTGSSEISDAINRRIDSALQRESLYPVLTPEGVRATEHGAIDRALAMAIQQRAPSIRTELARQIELLWKRGLVYLRDDGSQIHESVVISGPRVALVNAKVGPFSTVAGPAFISSSKINSHCALEDHVVVSNSFLASHVVVNYWVDVRASLINSFSHVRSFVIIGENSLLGSGVLCNAGTHFERYPHAPDWPTTIEIGAWNFIGQGVTLCGGARTGTGVVVGARATLSTQVSDHLLVIGDNQKLPIDSGLAFLSADQAALAGWQHPEGVILPVFGPPTLGLRTPREIEIEWKHHGVLRGHGGQRLLDFQLGAIRRMAEVCLGEYGPRVSISTGNSVRSTITLEKDLQPYLTPSDELLLERAATVPGAKLDALSAAILDEISRPTRLGQVVAGALTKTHLAATQRASVVAAISALSRRGLITPPILDPVLAQSPLGPLLANPTAFPSLPPLAGAGPLRQETQTVPDRALGVPAAKSAAQAPEMSFPKIVEVVLRLLGDVIGARDTAISLSETTPLAGLLGSLAIARLLASLERAFGVSLNLAEAVRYQDLSTATSIASIVREKISHSSGHGEPTDSRISVADRDPEPSDIGLLGSIENVAKKDPQRLFMRRAPLKGATSELTYGQLLAEALRIAAGLEAIGVQPGEVVALISTDDTEIAKCFVGCLFRGAIPTILAPPSPKVAPNRYVATLEALVRRSAPALFVASDATLGETKELLAKLGIRLGVREYPALTSAARATGARSSPSKDSPAFLQHSSGTTGLQKGVVITYGMLDQQMAVLRDAIAYSDDDRIISWLPLYHDMGLIACFLLPLYYGRQVTQIPTFDWLRDPASLITEMSRQRSTLCWLPNFAFQHLAKFANEAAENWDLRSLRMVINCSETLTSRAFDKFLAAFARHGLRETALSSSYAMAEYVFYVSQSVPGRTPVRVRVDRGELRRGRVKVVDDAPGALTLVSSGRISPPTEVRIMRTPEETATAMEVGEIAIRGPSLTREYHKNPESTTAAFCNGWYFTGDLGFVVDDELFVTGRKKDLVIIAGENIYPSDVEDAVNESGAVHPGRAVAFGAFDEAEGTQAHVVMVEPRHDVPSDDNEVSTRVRTAIGAFVGLAVRRVLVVPPGWLVKSTSGKVSRSLSYQKALSEGLLEEPVR